MSRTLISRGLAVVCTSLVVLGLAAPGTASARPSGFDHGRQHLELSGSWTDPGAVIDTIGPSPYPAKVMVTMHGQTTTTGGFTGTSTYLLTVLFDTATNVSIGNGIENFTASLGSRGSGHVSFRERVIVNTDGSEVVVGRIIAGDGVFSGATGAIRYTGTTDPSGAYPGTGGYRMWIDLAH